MDFRADVVAIDPPKSLRKVQARANIVTSAAGVRMRRARVA
jgi:hypothetical protein